MNYLRGFQMTRNSKNPNIVLIVTDQQRRHSLGCYGNKTADTPNIDRIAGSGIVFDNAYTANVICSPSRASIHTGRMPCTHGLITNGCYLSPFEITLPEVLGSHGYRTAHVGKCHLSPHSRPDQNTGNDSGEFISPEGPEFWGKGGSLPLPYYGYQEARICSGHGSDWMDYHRDLVSVDAKLPDLLKKENALEPPSGAPSSWKSGIPEEHHCSTWIADNAVGYLEAYARSEDPFFLFVGFPDPHFPYCPPAPWCHLFDPADVPMPHRSRDELQKASKDYAWRIERFAEAWPYHPFEMPDAHIREIIAHTYGMVSLLDRSVGRITGALERLGLTNSTVIIFTTDHGEHTGDHWLIYKCSPFDELIHLPLMWSWPSHFEAGKRFPQIVSHIDIMPTVLDIAGIPHPRGVQGLSYAGGLKSEDFQGRPYAYLEDDEEDGKGFLRTIRTPDFRLSYYLPAQDGELFDLQSDPNEFVNCWNDSAYRNIRDGLIELMLQATIQASDPKPERVART